ncbi:MAG TPA: peptidylprolyl isomerase [Pyrinomonadaceae bacterium]|nr:peptidylprolyl isomerase [Pyrinomonadaceae bacterium]
MSSLSKGLILLVVILGIGVGLVFWKNKVGGHSSSSFGSISKEEVELLLADVAKVNPMVLKRFKEDPEMKKDQLNNLKELLAFASQAQKEGLANESPNKDELENIRAEVIAVTYDKEINKDKGPMPPFGFITEDRIKAFWGEGEQPAKGWFDNFKDKIGLGKKDREIEFTKFLDSKVAILKRDNPQMKDREITDEERTQAREFFAKIRIYLDEYQEKAGSGELPKAFQDKVNLQVKLQQAQFLARLYSEQMAEKAKVSDEDVDKYIAEHPELDISAKRTKAEEILNRAKSGEDFAKLADEFSEDPGNSAGTDGKKRGGLYENIRPGQMVKPFEDAALAVEPGQINPNLVETDFGYHIIKLESKNAAAEGDAQAAATYTARHILISTGVKDVSNPMGRETPVKQFARTKLEEEKQKKLIEDAVVANHIQVPEDFDVPEVTDEQIQDAMKKQQQQMGPEDGEMGPPPPAPGKDPKGVPPKKSAPASPKQK